MTKPEIEKALAEARERIEERLASWDACGNIDCGNRVCTHKCPDLERMADQILSRTVSIGGGVCPVCGGLRREDAPFVAVHCLKCNGTGKLPITMMTIKEIIEEKLNE